MNVIARIRYDLVSGMKYSSEHDAFTDLPNRSAFFAAVRRLPADCPRKRFAMVCMDISSISQPAASSAARKRAASSSSQWLTGRVRGRDDINPAFTAESAGDAFCICAPNHAEIIPEEAAKIYKEIAGYNPKIPSCAILWRL